jgi:hypothetical protein
MVRELVSLPAQDVSQEMEPAVVAHTDVEDILLEMAVLRV